MWAPAKSRGRSWPTNGRWTQRDIVRDLTQGSILKQIISLAVPICGAMIITPLYQLIDLYFVSPLGDAAIAGVGAAATAGSLINALNQMVNVGATALIAQAAGRKDRADANLVFNQALGMAAILGVTTLVVGFILANQYMRWISGDDATIRAGTKYLIWFMPALALQYAMMVIAAALRGTGIVMPTIIIQILAVLSNIGLAPVLIAGWGTGLPLGVAGAGFASSLAMAVGVATLWIYFHLSEHYVGLNPKLSWPQLAQWRRILRIGLPAGGEFTVMFIYMTVAYYALGGFGAAAQAGFGVGARVLGLIQTPVMAIAFAAGPIVGQSIGAANIGRVRETVKTVSFLSFVMMILLTVLVQLRPEFFVGGVTKDESMIVVGSLFLRIVSLCLVPQGLVFVCSSMFQGLGNTKPSLLSSGLRLATYGPPMIWLSGRAGFHMADVWWWSLPTTTLQAAVSVYLLRREIRKVAARYQSRLSTN